MTKYPRAAADAIHQSTKHGTPPVHPERLMRYRRLDPSNLPRPFKTYRQVPLAPLPREVVPSTLPAGRVLSGEPGDPTPLDASLLATLLFLAAGVTRFAERGSGDPVFFRAAMSAGNLHPVEVYVVAGDGVEGVAAGVHHFAPLDFALTELRRGDHRAALAVETPAALVLTGIVWRTTWKYGERGWRHLYWDAGTMLANLLTAAAAHGVDAQVFTGFADETVSALVGIDGMDEVPLAVVTLGGGERGHQPELKANPDLPPVQLDVAPVAPDPVGLPLLIEAQTQSRLAADEVQQWREAADEVGSPPASRVAPPGAAREEPIEDVILRRGSTRNMRHDSVPEESIHWAVAVAARAVPLDAAPHGGFLQHFLNVHAVEGMRPGAYRWEENGLHLLEEQDALREVSTRLCLDQPLGGDSAYTAFHHADLGAILAALGSRGYRAAHLEAGIVSGRLALAAFAQGLGATGLTFYDDLVSRHFGTATAPILVTAVGVPAGSPAPAGRPGEPVAIRTSGLL